MHHYLFLLLLSYLIIRNSLPQETIGDLRNLVDHVFENPSGLMKKAKEVNFCGFLVSAHRHILSYRHIAYNLPYAAIAKTLMDTSSVVFGNDIFHATSEDCASTKPLLPAHSDQNQDWVSIEKKINYGDNMVVGWLALDNLGYGVELTAYPKTHKLFDQYENNRFTHDKYCTFWKKNQSYVEALPKIKIDLDVGDILIFQGMLWHEVKYSKNCTIDTCRRISFRYFNGENSHFRTDVEPSAWPEISNFPWGELISEILPVVAHEDLSKLSWGIFEENTKIHVGFFETIKFFWWSVWNEGTPMINACPHRKASNLKAVQKQAEKEEI